MYILALSIKCSFYIYMKNSDQRNKKNTQTYENKRLKDSTQKFQRKSRQPILSPRDTQGHPTLLPVYARSPGKHSNPTVSSTVHVITKQPSPLKVDRFPSNSVLELDMNLSKRNSESEKEDQQEEGTLLKLQLQQLRRENRFLKKKIAQLKMGKEIGQSVRSSRQTHLSKHLSKNASCIEISNLQSSFQFLLEEVKHCLQSCREFYTEGDQQRDDLKSDLRGDPKDNSKEDVRNEPCRSKISKALPRDSIKDLSKCLMKVSFQSEESKYLSLLSLFEQFYDQKVRSESAQQQKVEQLFRELLEVENELLTGAQIRKSLRIAKKSFKSKKEVDQGYFQKAEKKKYGSYMEKTQGALML